MRLVPAELANDIHPQEPRLPVVQEGPAMLGLQTRVCGTPALVQRLRAGAACMAYGGRGSG